MPHEWLFYAVAGYANLVMDIRGQGSAWSRGDTPDHSPEPVDPQFPGFMTRGLRSPETYYYRRLITDAVRAVEAARRAPYTELVSFCAVQRHQVDNVLATLSYVDGVNFAARATAPALFSVGLMDPTCPPSTVYAAYHHYAGPKRMCVWPYNQHEGGQAYQQAEHITFLRETFGG